MQDERLIIVAPNGARRTHQDHPALPVSPEEIADTVAACVDAGAAMVHLHARNAKGEHSLEISDNLAVLEEVRRRVGDRVIVQVTTEAVGRYQPAQQMALIRALEPEAASFALRELIPLPEYESSAADFFHWAAERNILAQYILYSEQDLLYYLDLLERDLLPKQRHHLLFVLGRYAANQQSTPNDLQPFTRLLPRLNGRRWAVCAFGAREQECLLAAAEQGGDLRVGFENNLFACDGELAVSNADQVRSLVMALKKSGYIPASVNTLRTDVGFQ